VTTTDRREQERVRRKQDVLQAARALLAQDGFGRATVAAVAQRAEMGKGTIYLYFESKEAILAELVLEAPRELSSRLQATGEGQSVLHLERRLRAMTEAYLTFAHQAPDYFRLISAFNHGGYPRGISPLRQQQILIESMRALDPVTEAIADGMALGTSPLAMLAWLLACFGALKTVLLLCCRAPSAAPCSTPTSPVCVTLH